MYDQPVSLAVESPQYMDSNLDGPEKKSVQNKKCIQTNKGIRNKTKQEKINNKN